MKRIAATLALVASTAVAAPRFERAIVVERAGPQRLAVDLPLVAGAAPALRDLRIYDRSGREAPYLLVDPPGRDPEWVRTRRFEITPTKTTSGIEVDLRGRHLVDALRIENVTAPFLKRVRVEGSGDRHRWILLDETTVFDLPAEGLERTTVEFAPSDLRYLRLTWDDSSSARVKGVPGVLVRVHGSAVPPPSLRGDVPIAKRRSEPGRSRYHVDLPAAALPIRAVQLMIPRGDLFRQAVVSEPRLAGSEIVPVTLGSAHLRQAERDGLVASATSIPISSPRSQELDIVIEDGSNPPLHVERAFIELDPQPWIYFEAAAAGTFIARYGDAALGRPRYDLEAARPFLTRARLATARWESPRNVPASAQLAPSSAPLPTTGAPVDRDRFRIARPLAPAKPGMAVLTLDADVLARSRELSDVRLVDAGGRQVPFIVEQRNEPLLLDVRVGPRRETDDNISSYTLELPYQRLPSGTRLVLTTGAGIFERVVTLQETSRDDRDPRVIAAMTWRHTDPDRLPPPLHFNLPARAIPGLELKVAEGDNAALPISTAQLVLPSYALRFYHPGKSIALLYGNPDVGAPRYDLALLAPRLFGEPAQQISFAAAASSEPGSEGFERRFFWVAIGAVALVLMLLLARLLRPLAQNGPP